MKDLASRLNSRVQLTTDGHKAYLYAVEGAFGIDVDFAQLIKIYGKDSHEDEKWYSPPQMIESKKNGVIGNPDPKHVSTSFAERQNLTMRMSMRRFTRLTNAHSKKIKNHINAISLHFMYYNFCKIYQSLRVSPATEAEVTDRFWNIEDIIKLIN